MAFVSESNFKFPGENAAPRELPCTSSSPPVHISYLSITGYICVYPKYTIKSQEIYGKSGTLYNYSPLGLSLI